MKLSTLLNLVTAMIGGIAISQALGAAGVGIGGQLVGSALFGALLGTTRVLTEVGK